jgi:hypothetical protein
LVGYCVGGWKICLAAALTICLAAANWGDQDNFIACFEDTIGGGLLQVDAELGAIAPGLELGMLGDQAIEDGDDGGMGGEFELDFGAFQHFLVDGEEFDRNGDGVRLALWHGLG